MYFVLKSLKCYLHYSAVHVSDTIVSIIRSFSAAHAVSGPVWCLVRCVLQSCCVVTVLLQHSRIGGHNEPSTTRDQRLHVQLRSSWWGAQWCPKHVELNNVNKILRILKQSTSSWRFYSSYCNDVRNHEPGLQYLKQVARNKEADSYTPMKRMSCNNCRWKAANQQKNEG